MTATVGAPAKDTDVEESRTHEPLTRDQVSQLMATLRQINARLAPFRGQIIHGFANRADEAMCARLCLARTRIVLILNEENGE